MSRQCYKDQPQQQSGKKQAEILKVKVFESVYVTLFEKELRTFRDKLSYEYKQQPVIVIKLENITKVNIFKFNVPPPQAFQQQQHPMAE